MVLNSESLRNPLHVLDEVALLVQGVIRSRPPELRAEDLRHRSLDNFSLVRQFADESLQAVKAGIEGTEVLVTKAWNDHGQPHFTAGLAIYGAQ
ncbi:hypothetical protein HBH53_039390 [Parastagonospora nodorum]|nr:hypothetical protein HBH53_039390 [Parastagonospora nodorum]KAH4849015.1 hypothetical protein HBH75_149570 [Parastagonospora nodorum]KAH5181868.1 hypothetical protein HBH76_157480 [Parastagonospora nodorum]KAH5365025.1 hypothetical protein HBI49_109960 [Parastagonospora nodorum]KAH5381822.1 hypothetical protein HBI33_138700 [Parastagonospora nodorum]